MTRLAIVGSSHVGAIRQAAPRIEALYPGLKIGYFALPGRPFRSMYVDGAGILRFRPETDAEGRAARKVNGAEHLDLGPFDRVWVIGNRFEFGRIMRLFLEHDVLEWPRTGRARTMSETFGCTVLETMIDRSCTRIGDRFGSDPRVVLTPAPYLGASARTEGEGFDRWMSKLFDHPNGERLQTLFERTIRDRLKSRGYGFMAQPPGTLAAPFATRAEYLRDARDFQDPGRRLNDLRHMNADYGFEVFRAFAELHLGKG